MVSPLFRNGGSLRRLIPMEVTCIPRTRSLRWSFSLLLLQAGDAVCESQRLQDPGVCFFNRERLVAGVAVLRDGHLLIGCGVRSIMAAKAPREVGMSEIVGVCAPGDLEIGKHIPVVDGCDLSRGFGDVPGALGGDGRIGLLIETSQRRRNNTRG